MGGNCRCVLLDVYHALDVPLTSLLYDGVVPKSVQPGTTTTARSVAKLTKASPRCAKCVTTNKSGRQSCCARGGAWFKNCGDAGDMKFNHTWAEGIQACESMFPIGADLGCVLYRYNMTDLKTYPLRQSSCVSTETTGVMTTTSAPSRAVLPFSTVTIISRQSGR